MSHFPPTHQPLSNPTILAGKSHAQLVDQVLVSAGSALLSFIEFPLCICIGHLFSSAQTLPKTSLSPPSLSTKILHPYCPCNTISAVSIFFFFQETCTFLATVFFLYLPALGSGVCAGYIIAKAICRGQWKPLSLVGIFEALIYSINSSGRSARRSLLNRFTLFGQFGRGASCMRCVVVNGDDRDTWLPKWQTNGWKGLKLSGTSRYVWVYKRKRLR